MGITYTYLCDLHGCGEKRYMASEGLPSDWSRVDNKIYCSPKCAEASDTLTIEQALDRAFRYGERIGSSYRGILASMGSRHNISQADAAAEVVKGNWPGVKSQLMKQTQNHKRLT